MLADWPPPSCMRILAQDGWSILTVPQKDILEKTKEEGKRSDKNVDGNQSCEIGPHSSNRSILHRVGCRG